MPTLSKRPDTIVLVHGFWVTPRSWEHWIPRYEAQGYRVLAPAYPGFEVEVEALNRDPSPVERLMVPAIMAQLEVVVGRCEVPPILMGHSAGGAFVQLLLDRGYGAVGVAINSAPTEGVRVTPLSRLKSGFPVLKNPANRHRAVAFTYEQWRYVFTNTFDEADARAAYERYHVPASGGIFWDSVLANFIPGPQDIAVDYHNDARAPLLFISGSDDHLMPPAVRARTRSTTSRTRSRRSGSSRDARISCPPSRGGRKSRTMHWRGPRSTVRTSRRPLRHLHEMRPPNVAAGLPRRQPRLFVLAALTNGDSQMTTSMTEGAAATSAKPRAAAAAEDRSIRPFAYHATDAELNDLRRRIEATRWPEQETVADTSQGVPLAPLQDLARYWATDYDWRKCETKLNALPQFTTEIDGLDIHFIHMRSKHKGALPVIVTHGWPGSILEQIKLVGPLTDPTAFGGRAEDAFDVVIPSIPGYGFSGKPTATGWDPVHIARAWIVLMRRLGYRRYVAQGGDVGGLITDAMAVEAPTELAAMHTNFLFALPQDVSSAITGGPAPSELSDLERRALDKLKGFFAKNAAYTLEMATRPQTLYGLADSPVSLAAWLIDHGDGDDQPAATVLVAMRTPTRRQPPERLTRDDVLDNITLYWLTNTGVSSARSYWENKLPYFGPKNFSIPAAVSVFPGEVYQPSRRWAEGGYSKLSYFHEVDKGGHFAAWEEPLLFAAELRAAFRSRR